MNTKLNQHRFWPCHENGLIETTQTIPHNLCMSFKLTSLYCGLRPILVYPNPQLREADLTLTYRLWGTIIWIVMISPFSWQWQNLCWLSLVFIIDWRAVFLYNFEPFSVFIHSRPFLKTYGMGQLFQIYLSFNYSAFIFWNVGMFLKILLDVRRYLAHHKFRENKRWTGCYNIKLLN